MKPRPVTIDLEVPVQQVEKHLADLHEALRGGDPAALECSAAALHRALSGAVEHFRAAAHHGAVPPPLRQRLALASARVAAFSPSDSMASTSPCSCCTWSWMSWWVLSRNSKMAMETGAALMGGSLMAFRPFWRRGAAAH